MGAEHRTRTLTALALAVSVFTPTIAFAKTLQGAGGGSAAVDGVLAGPPIAGTPPPMLVPPSLAPMIVPPPAPVAGPGIDDEPAPETIAAGESEGSESVAVPRTVSGVASDAETPLVGSTAARSAPAPTSPPPGVGPRVAGPPLPRQVVPSTLPAALALRAGPTGAAAAGAPTTTITSESSEPDVKRAPTTGGSSTVASSAVVVIPDGIGSSNCTSLPRPGQSNALLDWTTSRTAEITDGRDLRSHARFSATAGGPLPLGAAGPIAAYLLEPNSLAILAVFRETDDGVDRAADRPSRPIPDLRIADCDGGPADGIRPGSYLIRYSITGTPDRSASGQNEAFVSPPFPVRVLAGPTAPSLTSAGPNVSQS